MRLLNGKDLDFNNLSRDVITPEFIARCLSRLCRFQGQTEEFYSVARHCIILASLFTDPKDKYEALMHELDETIIGDVPSPFKDSHRLSYDFYRREVPKWFMNLRYSYKLEYNIPEHVDVMDKRLGNTEFCYFNAEGYDTYPKETKEYIDKYPPPPIFRCWIRTSEALKTNCINKDMKEWLQLYYELTKELGI